LPKESVNEFAADDGDSGGEDDALRNYARMWWAGDEATQMQIEAVLAKMGWEIGEDEGGYDNGGVFVVRAGDINGDSYTSWAAEDLTEGMAEEYTRGAWKDEALDYKDFADLAYEKLTGAYGDKRRGIAQHYSRLENRTFGSAINQHGYTQLLIDLYKKANKDFTNPQDDTDTLSGTGFGHVSQREQGMAEGNRKPEPPEADYGADYQDMVSRVKKLAGLGPLKTVYDPAKRVYKNVPTAVQPKKEQR
jgi:hypothetical protein